MSFSVVNELLNHNNFSIDTSIPFEVIHYSLSAEPLRILQAPALLKGVWQTGVNFKNLKNKPMKIEQDIVIFTFKVQET